MSYANTFSRSRYTPVSGIDSESDGSEKQLEQRFSSRQPTMLTYVFAALIVLQFIALYLLHIEVTAFRPTSRQLKSPIPEFPTEMKSFHREDIYFNRSSPETDAAWEELAGPPRQHRGFINVPEYETFGLQTGALDDGKVIFGVSMFHQLHCLGAIRKIVWDLAYGNVDGHELIQLTPNDTSSDFDGGPKHGFWHIQHCFDFIRQALQCHGDVALEWPVQVKGKSLFVGWETPHQCRSYEAAWAYVDQHS